MNYKEASKLLGEALSAEPAVISFNAAKAAFDTDPELTSMMERLNNQKYRLIDFFDSRKEGRIL